MAVIQAKDHISPGAAVFGPLIELDFDPITLAASQANTAVQSQLAVPANCKILRISAILTGSAGTCSINVVAGTAAEGGVGSKETLAVAGTQLFSSDEALTIADNSPQYYQASVLDVIWPETLPLTVRTVTNGSGAGTLRLRALAQLVDPNISKGLTDSSGNLTF
jgi:hypothetical protein